MIDHIVGRPSPSWKRTQVNNHILSLPSILSDQTGFSCDLVLALEDHPW